MTYMVTLVVVTTYLMFYYRKRLADPIQKLVISTNPFEKMKLQMISHAFYFLSVTWFIIFMSFSLLL